MKAADASREEVYREIVEGADDLIVRVGADGRLAYVNRASEKILGIAPEDLVGRMVRDCIHPEDLGRSIEVCAMINQDDISCLTLENRWTDHAGEVRHISWTINARRDGAGNLVGFNGIGRDVTRLRHTEEALRRKEKDFRAIIANSVDGMIVLDGDGLVRYVNPAAEKLFGMTAADMAGEYFGFPICDAPVEMSVLRQFRTFIAVEMRLARIDWEGRPSHVITLRDLTDRILAEQTLRQVRDELETEIQKRVSELSRLNEKLLESEERLATAFHSTTVGFALLKMPGMRIVDANQAMLDIFGFTREEAIGKETRELNIFAEPSVWDKFTEDLLREDAIHVPEIQVRVKDGSTRIISVDSRQFAIRGENFHLCTAYDITDHKRADEELKAAKAQAELYLDLMGHDINNMHQIALGYLEIAAELEENDVMRELMARPRDVLLRSARLVDNVRKLQKLKDGHYIARPIELVKVLSAVLKEHEMVPGKELTLDTHAIDRGYVLANELLYDVFSNLVSNAIKHSGARAEITISLERIRANVGDCYQVSVEDNGPGVPDNFKQKVFNRMLQGDNRAKGMGLGLFLVKTLVESYGGRVWVEDRVKGHHTKGAKFIVLLPALQMD